MIEAVGQDLLPRRLTHHGQTLSLPPRGLPDAVEVAPEPDQADRVGQEVIAVDVGDLQVPGKNQPW